MSTHPHVFDNDATCVCCGFDGAEHSHLRYYTHEGRASQTPEPLCITSDYVREQRIAAAKRQGLLDEPEYEYSDEPLENFYSESAFGDIPSWLDAPSKNRSALVLPLCLSRSSRYAHVSCAYRRLSPLPQLLPGVIHHGHQSQRRPRPTS